MLAQQTDFATEILLGEDESSDGTREIALEYARKHPSQIKLKLGRRADVHRVHGRATGRRNLHTLLTAATGEYVALLDGDDYWISAEKLQSQVEYMDAHPECAIIGTDGWMDNGSERTLFSKQFWKKTGTIFSLSDIMSGDFVPPTCSILIRRSTLDFPELFWKTIAGDMAIFAICGLKGNFAVLPDPHVVYRINAGGNYSGGNMPGTRDTPTPASAERLLHTAMMFEEIMSFLGPTYYHILRNRCAGLHRDIAWLQRSIGDRSKMRSHALKAIALSGVSSRYATELIKLIGISFIPKFLHR